MYRNLPLLVLVLAAVCPVLADGTVTLGLTSSKTDLTVAPGTTIDWTITAEVSNTPPGQNAGLALLHVDLRQDPANPANLDIPPADGVPTTMTNFSRPAGISNPGEDGHDTGYIGVQRGPAGAMNLVQIGGAQNTLGTAGVVMGTSADVVSAIGHGGAVILAQGSFTAPEAAGTYVFGLYEAAALVLDEVNPPPAQSPVSEATIAYATQTFSFHVGQRGDVNCDGSVNSFDIDAFVQALTDPAGHAASYPGCDYKLADVGEDGTVNAFDIDPFVELLTRG